MIDIDITIRVRELLFRLWRSEFDIKILVRQLLFRLWAEVVR
jgi:hypothetical protein